MAEANNISMKYNLYIVANANKISKKKLSLHSGRCEYNYKTSKRSLSWTEEPWEHKVMVKLTKDVLAVA